LAAAKARILNLEDETAALRGALAHERKRHAAKPKAEKPAPTPDEARDRQIKALKTRMRNIMCPSCTPRGSGAEADSTAA
jgi:hypothetical protein